MKDAHMIARYTMDWVWQSEEEEGEWVRYEDHIKEVEALRARLDPPALIALPVIDESLLGEGK